MSSAQDAAAAATSEAEQLRGKLTALDSVVRGLREERQLWSRELVAQGANLAADRGKLESRVCVVEAELEGAKQEAANLREVVRIKTEQIEQQDESLRQHRAAAAARERQERSEGEEISRRTADVEQRLAAERELSCKLQGELETALDRKTALKDEMSELVAELDACRREVVRQQHVADDRAQLISQVEGEVAELRSNFQQREGRLVSERDALRSRLGMAEERLAELDDAFKKQLAVRTRQCEDLRAALKRGQAEVAQARAAAATTEGEMRELLRELSEKKLNEEARMDGIKQLLGLG